MAFRSEQMSMIQIYIPSEIAQQTASELGELGQIEFVDLNPQINAFQRAFVGEIRRLDEMERKIRYLQSQIEKVGMKIRPIDSPTNSAFTRPHTQKEIDELESKLSMYESKLLQMNSSQQTLDKRYFELTELRHVIREASVFLSQSNKPGDDGHREDAALLESGQDVAENDELVSGGDLGSITGVIARAKMGIFERILFRVLRGNLYMNHAEIADDVVDPLTEQPIKKNVFVIFAHGKELIAKIKKICESMGATLYTVDPVGEKRREAGLEVIGKLEDLKNVIDNTLSARKAELAKVAETLESWSIIIKKEKAVYHTMNQFNFDANRKALIAEGWCPTNQISTIQHALRSVTERTDSTIPPILNELRTTKIPPTYHKTNKFTAGFQAIVDAYGMATYQEVNPGLFTCISFPFLFAVMFGDFGHGLLVTAFAAWMVVKEKDLAKKKWGEIWDMMYGGRYMILLMGIFSIYTGLIYNDVFSRTMPIFGRGYNWVIDGDKIVGEKKNRNYPIGIDPIWMVSENKLMFLNSYKMKMGVILGVMQMVFGLVLGIFNHLQFKKPMYILAESVPQILFLLSIFGYLVCIIIYKWATNWDSIGRSPPSLLNTLIYMVLAPGSVQKDDELFTGQAGLQSFLLLLAFLCIPWMLCVKPYLEWKEMSKHSTHGYNNLEDHSAPTQIPGEASSPHHGEVTKPAAAEGGAGEAHEFSEVIVHQIIHTIEFVLSSISHTASYLRLWALSLAHAQLSEVLWDMVLAAVFTMNPNSAPLGLMFTFYMWFNLTVFILIAMEGLSAFLHALRLHWVEFNSKFYLGGGRPFVPFSFSSVLSDSETDD